MVRAFRLLCVCVISLLAAAPAFGAFHTYRIAEVFSSADGTVQFIRLHEGSGATFQNFFSGQTLTCSDGVTTHTFMFPNDLPSTETANTDVLIATANFSTLAGGVTPDFVIPAGFLFTGGGTLTFASFVSTVNYGPLPANGQTSVNAAGVPGVNTPRNFAGMAGSVNVPPGPCCVGTSCSVTVQVSCSETWTAAGTCNPNPCAPATGACCAGVTCQVTTAAACTGVNTAFIASPACNAGGNNVVPCCKANFNHVNDVSVQDIFDFLGAWFAGSPTADMQGNGAGTPTVQGIFDFLAAWFAGC